jgi:methionyl aminopeptidase
LSELIETKTSREISLLRDAAKLASDILAEVRLKVKPGISTKELDELAYGLIKGASAEPAFLGYRGYPATLCISLNNELVHGIPSASRVIRDGDIVSVDLGVKYKGFYGDLAETLPAGAISDDKQNLMEVTYGSLVKALEFCRVGLRVGDISAGIQAYVEGAHPGLFVVRDYVGHGIGRNLHEKPEVPNFGKPGTGPRLLSGMVFTIEPMVAAGSHRVRTLSDNWTVVTENGKMCAHYEHMIYLTDNGPEVLTVIKAPGL